MAREWRRRRATRTRPTPASPSSSRSRAPTSSQRVDRAAAVWPSNSLLLVSGALDHERRHGRVLRPEPVCDVLRPPRLLPFAERRGLTCDAGEALALETDDDGVVLSWVLVNGRVLGEAELRDEEVLLA